MSKIRHSQSIITIGICFGLFMGACVNQVFIPTQTIVPVNSPTTKVTRLPVQTITITSILSPTKLAARETQNSIITTNAKVATEMAILPNCGSPLNRDYSPDGNWVAIECLEYGIGIYNLKDFSKSWYFSYYNIFGLKYENGNHFGKLKPKHWSRDGKYLYFTPFFGGDGGCVDYAEGQALLRLDLSSGKYSELLSPTENSSYYNFSFSNDDKYLVYFEVWQEHPILNLYNLASSERQEIPLGEKYSGAGFLIWSQDNTQVLFSAHSGEKCESMPYYLVALNLRDQTQRVVFEGDKVKYFPVKWIDKNLVLVEAGFSEEYFYMDIVTGKILAHNQSTSTPKP